MQNGEKHPPLRQSRMTEGGHPYGNHGRQIAAPTAIHRITQRTVRTGVRTLQGLEITTFRVFRDFRGKKIILHSAFCIVISFYTIIHPPSMGFPNL
ncbi:MAG: hypothetical protein FWH14_00930 [Oscillospiraceae bacterium]|nr:hypothetical protein [Oscillospiraceae bacterium]